MTVDKDLEHWFKEILESLDKLEKKTSKLTSPAQKLFGAVLVEDLVELLRECELYFIAGAPFAEEEIISLGSRKETVVEEVNDFLRLNESGAFPSVRV
jgi:hypothetical protein